MYSCLMWTQSSIDTIPLASGVKWVVLGLTNTLIVLAEMRNWLLSAKVEFGTFLQLAMLHVVKWCVLMHFAVSVPPMAFSLILIWSVVVVSGHLRSFHHLLGPSFFSQHEHCRSSCPHSSANHISSLPPQATPCHSYSMPPTHQSRLTYSGICPMDDVV